MLALQEDHAQSCQAPQHTEPSRSALMAGRETTDVECVLNGIDSFDTSLMLVHRLILTYHDDISLMDI